MSIKHTHDKPNTCNLMYTFQNFLKDAPDTSLSHGMLNSICPKSAIGPVWFSTLQMMNYEIVMELTLFDVILNIP